MRRLAIRSIIVGGLIDVFAASFLGAVSVVFVLLLLSIAHTPPENTSAVTNGIVHGNAVFIGAQIAIGGLCSILGGYIAARLARHDERLNGAVSSFLSVGSAIVALAAGHDPDHVLLQVLTLPIKPMLGAVGGYLREAEVRSKLAAVR